MTFQLWDIESANLLGSYETEAAALEIVRKTIDNHGREAIDGLMLLREAAHSRRTTIAEGAKLADRAFAKTSPAA
jgi:hypothetical protein